jgi:hypothetical protein
MEPVPVVDPMVLADVVPTSALVLTPFNPAIFIPVKFPLVELE